MSFEPVFATNIALTDGGMVMATGVVPVLRIAPTADKAPLLKATVYEEISELPCVARYTVAVPDCDCVRDRLLHATKPQSASASMAAINRTFIPIHSPGVHQNVYQECGRKSKLVLIGRVCENRGLPKNRTAELNRQRPGWAPDS